MQGLWVDAPASVRDSKGFGAARPLTPSETLNPKSVTRFVAAPFCAGSETFEF